MIWSDGAVERRRLDHKNSPGCSPTVKGVKVKHKNGEEKRRGLAAWRRNLPDGTSLVIGPTVDD